MMLGNALIPRKGYTNPETHAAFKKAYALARKLNDPKTLPAALYGLWVNQWMGAKYSASIEPAVEALSFAETVGDAGLLVSPDRPEDWADALIRILSDSDLADRLADAGRMRAERFTWESTASKSLEAYFALAGRG